MIACRETGSTGRRSGSGSTTVTETLTRYCVYSDRQVGTAEGNWDHVYPLSLGGTNQFVVWSEIALNSKMGSVVDGALVNDPLMALHLAKADVKGHGKRSRPRTWRAKLGDRPAQIQLEPHGMKLWDARERRTLEVEEIGDTQITANFSVGAFTALRFLAKAALGGGYFVYGNAMLPAIDCTSLRKIMLLDPIAAKQDAALLTCNFQICDRFHADAQPNGPLHTYRVACEMTGRSLFIAQPHANGIAFHVGVVGQYIGTIFCPGDTTEIPKEGGLHEGGQAIFLAPGKMVKVGFHDALRDLLELLEKAKSDQTDPPPA